MNVDVWLESEITQKYGAQISCPYECDSVYNIKHQSSEKKAVTQVVHALKYHLQRKHKR